MTRRPPKARAAGKPWLTQQSLAAVQLKAPFNAGYQVKKTIEPMEPVEQANKGIYSTGDVVRVTLKVNASGDMTWVAMTDPGPGGATLLGSGSGRNSEIETKGKKLRRSSGGSWPAFEAGSFEAFRSFQ